MAKQNGHVAEVALVLAVVWGRTACIWEQRAVEV